MGKATARSVVLISIDTLRYDCVGLCARRPHLSAYGLADSVATPNLDAFLARSVYFTEALSPAPITTSAHASVMTGLYPARHGARALFTWALADGVRTLAQQLEPQGYSCVAVLEDGDGSFMRAGSGVLNGFDTFFTDERDACRHCAALDGPVLLFLHVWDVHSPYCWSLCEEVRAQDAARRRAEADLCGVLGIEAAAGDDWQAQTAFWRRVSRAARSKLDEREAARLFLDWYVRGVNWFDSVRWPRIVRSLKQAGLYDDAVIVLFGDHGEALLPDGAGLPMWHLSTVLDDALRVPLAVKAPGLAAEQVGGQASLLDVAPTVLDLLGLGSGSLGLDGETDGRSLLPAEGGRAAAREFAFAEAWDKAPALDPRQEEDAGLEARLREVWAPVQACVRTSGAKLLWHPGAPALGRFRTQASGAPDRSQRPRGRLRTLMHERLPTPLVRMLRAATARMHGEGAGTPPDLASPAAWREAPLFLIDLQNDPLELRPRPCGPTGATEEELDLLEGLREYWQGGVTGPAIRLAAGQGPVLRRLKDLGYAD
jgi:arylsulfatase A-like enzyme